MRTNVVIDDELMAEVLRLTGLPTKRAAVDAGLRLLRRMALQRELRQLRGALDWEGDLDQMRRDA